MKSLLYRAFLLLTFFCNVNSFLIYGDELDNAIKILNKTKEGLKKADNVTKKVDPILKEAIVLWPQISKFIDIARDVHTEVVQTVPLVEKMVGSLQETVLLAQKLKAPEVVRVLPEGKKIIKASEELQKNVTKVQDSLNKIQADIDFFKTYSPKIQSIIDDIQKSAPQIMPQLRDIIAIFQEIKPILEQIISILRSTAGVGASVRDAGKMVGKKVKGAGEDIASGAQTAANKVSSGAKSTWKNFKKMF